MPFVTCLNWRLSHHYESEGYILHGDRFFSSAKTAIALKSKGIDYCGSVNLNRVLANAEI
jgi:hypothetical protein